MGGCKVKPGLSWHAAKCGCALQMQQAANEILELKDGVGVWELELEVSAPVRIKLDGYQGQS